MRNTEQPPEVEGPLPPEIAPPAGAAAGARFDPIPFGAGAARVAVDVLYLDDAFLALNKPAGWATSPDAVDPGPDLLSALHEGIRAGAPWARRLGLVHLAAAHRLDRDTTGVFLLARSRETHFAAAGLFGHRRVAETYAALVRGAPDEDAWRVDRPIGPATAGAGAARAGGARSRPAATAGEVAERFRGYALLRARPETGRRRQVRLHLRAMGCPVVADAACGDARPLMLSSIKRGYKPSAGDERPLLARSALHLETLEFEHPVTRRPVRIEAPWPKDLLLAVKYLRRFAAPRRPHGDIEIGARGA